MAFDDILARCVALNLQPGTSVNYNAPGGSRGEGVIVALPERRRPTLIVKRHDGLDGIEAFTIDKLTHVEGCPVEELNGEVAPEEVEALVEQQRPKLGRRAKRPAHRARQVNSQ